MTDDNTQPPAETLAEDTVREAVIVLDVFLAAYARRSDDMPVYLDSDDDNLLRWGHLRTILAALTRRAGGDDAEREALAGYRAAVSFIAADSWDGCSDCVETLKAAWAADWQNDQAADPDETARQLARIRAHRPPVEPRAGGDAIPAGEEGDADWMHVARESVAAALSGSAFADRIMAGLHDDSLEVRAAMRAIDATLAAPSEGRSHG